MRNVAFSTFYRYQKCHFFMAAATGKERCVLPFIIQNLRLFRTMISAGLDGSNPAEIKHYAIYSYCKTELD